MENLAPRSTIMGGHELFKLYTKLVTEFLRRHCWGKGQNMVALERLASLQTVGRSGF